MGAYLQVILVEWQPLFDEYEREVRKHVASTRGVLAGLRDGRLGAGLPAERKDEIAAMLEGKLERPKDLAGVTALDVAWRAAEEAARRAFPTGSLPPLRGSWFAEYEPLSYPGAGKDFSALGRVWDSMRDLVDPTQSARFDPFFHRIGWRSDSYDCPGESSASGLVAPLHRDIRVELQDEPTLVLAPDTIATLLASWRGDLVHQWSTLRDAFERGSPDRFGTFEKLGAFVLRWIDGFEVAQREGRALVAAYSP